MAIPLTRRHAPSARAAALAALVAAALPAAGCAPAHAQLAGAGFVPALAPHTVQQAPLLNVGYARWDGSDWPLARVDAWFGRVGTAAALGSAAGGGTRAAHGSVAALLELLPQGVGVTAPGIQLQAGYSVSGPAGDRRWSVPVALGVLLHAPLPLPGRAHLLVHPALSVRHVVAGSQDADGTSTGLGVRAVFTDGAGPLTLWGAHGYVRLGSTGADRGPRWEAAVTRVLRRSAPSAR